MNINLNVVEKMVENEDTVYTEKDGILTVSKGSYSIAVPEEIFNNPVGTTGSGNVRFGKKSLTVTIQGVKIRFSLDIYSVGAKK